MMGNMQSGNEILDEAISQMKPELSAVLVSEEIGRLLALRRQARNESDSEKLKTLNDRIRQMIVLRDRIHAGDEKAIDEGMSVRGMSS